ncbi:MAG: substrate-binding domain-containing protein [Caldicoprobacterales bacterium]|nr:substrate-binding domain-containing protein [Clostridiales bacterium]
MKKITIKDIAQDLNVSVATVYRALHNKGRIKEETRQRVIEKAKELNYTANSTARKLALRRKFKILVVMPDQPEFFWDDIRKGLTVIAQELADFNTEIHTYYVKSTRDPDIHLEIMKEIEEKEIDSLLIVPLYIYKFDQLMEYTKNRSIPTAVFSTKVDHEDTLFYYGPDDTLSGFMAGELLSKFINQNGSICVMVRKEDFTNYSQRFQGFCKYLQTSSPLINVLDVYTYDADHEEEILEKALANSSLKAIYVMDGGCAGIFGKLLKDKSITGITLIGHEISPLSKAMLLEDHITALLYEERFYQGYYPVKLLYEYLVQGTLPTEKYIYTNINVVLKGNVHYLDYNDNGRGYR